MLPWQHRISRTIYTGAKCLKKIAYLGKSEVRWLVSRLPAPVHLNPTAVDPRDHHHLYFMYTPYIRLYIKACDYVVVLPLLSVMLATSFNLSN